MESTDITVLLGMLRDLNKSNEDDIKQAMHDACNEITNAKLRIKALKILLKACVCGPRNRRDIAVRDSVTKYPEGLATRVHDLLSERGSMPVSAIVAELKVSAVALRTVVEHCDWFESHGGEVHIAKTR
jgi:hypothetical protein